MSIRPLARVAALAAVALVALSGCSSSGDSKNFTYTSATSPQHLIPVADRKPAQNFSGSLLSGGSTSLKATSGKVRVVNFWATWCPPCQVETPQLQLFYEQMKAKGVQLLGIDFKDQKSQARSFVAAKDVTYPMIFDQQGETAVKLGNPPASLPFTYLIDKQGRVAAVYLGGLTGKDLQGPVDKLLAES